MLTAIRNLFRLFKLGIKPELTELLAQLGEDYRLHKCVNRDHPEFVVEAGVVLLGYSAERFDVGKGRVSRGTVLSFGDSVTGYGKIAIGNGTWIGQYNNLRASSKASISIGQKCLISQFCTLIGANHNVMRSRAIMDQPQNENKMGVKLGDDVWLGAGVVVLPGVAIGTGAVIGAGSVVTCDIPEYEIWFGNPARKHRERT